MRINYNVSAAMQQRITIHNKRGEKLAGVLHETGSEKMVVLCHGFRSSKENKILVNLAVLLENEGITAFRFDFSGNGEGIFRDCNYLGEAEELRAVIEYFAGVNRSTVAILGHSKAGNVVLLYASKYRDIGAVVNLSGRYDLNRGIEESLGKNYLERLKKDGYIDVKTKTGEVDYRVTEESMMERLNTNMNEVCHAIDMRCKVLTVHGSADKINPVEDAVEFAKIIPNHKLQIIQGANHIYTSHQDELAAAGGGGVNRPLKNFRLKNFSLICSESEGLFHYGNYRSEAEDLRAVIEYFTGVNRSTFVVLGHSKAGNVVLLYASKYHDIGAVVNLSGRYDLNRGIEERLGKNYLERLKKDGYIDVKTKTGEVDYRVTEESMMERLNTNMHEACHSIDKKCMVLTVHGSADEIIPVEDALELFPFYLQPREFFSMQQKITILNKRGEKLVGVLYETGSEKIVVLCHGHRSTKEQKAIVNLAVLLENEGISAFRLIFLETGTLIFRESEGVFQYGNYLSEAEELRNVIEHFNGVNRSTVAILGYSKGGNIVLLYASKYHDIGAVVNISGRYEPSKGIEERPGKNFLERINKDGYIDVKTKTGEVDFRVTEESTMERINTNMDEACHLIDKRCKVLTVHGSADKIAPNHKPQIIKRANHGYTSHQNELAAAVLPFIKECIQQNV
ncbi:hypothetical protein ACJIZ3_021321 [Penstemon smallii]|uniref:BAAT/Acyl-CoA thioester hydrolase C-terminal domain-containing protein n=1 Tax=Penstemon smallii TaxID=265156 RepID=A0ABD3SLX8_9LAMI